MKKVILSIIALPFAIASIAQTTTDNSLTVDQFVNEYLLGEGVQAFNVTYNGFAGDQVQPRVGSFDATNSDFPFEEGMVMATKNVQIVTCGAGTDGSGGGTDPDLSQIVTGGLNDVTVVEFDFIPEGDSVKFNFIFASREYHNFVCSGFNDVFGFFISGPGIAGPFTGGAENIALLPDGVTPVSINSVNNGNPSGSPCTGGGVSCPCNSEYFIDNGGGNGTALDSDVCYGGYTVPLVAQAAVVCGELYHMKLAIANILDGALDSGVFLEKGSFQSTAQVGISAAPISNGIVVGDNDFSEGIIAGCTDAQFCLYRQDTIGIDTSYFEIGGSAQPGVQYILPDESFVIFQEGVDTICIDIISIANDLGAQVDSLIFSAFVLDPCTGDTLTTNASLAVYNEYTFDIAVQDISIECPTDFVELSAGASNGVSPYNYQWALESDPGTIIGEGNTIEVEPPTNGETDTYIVFVTDACGLDPESTTINVTDNTEPDPIVQTSPNDTINCVGQTVILTATGSQGSGTLTYTWSTNEQGPQITVEPDGQQDVTYYFVTVTDECGITATDSVAVYFIPLEAPTADAGPDQTVVCAGDEVILTGTAEGGAAPYAYSWQTLGNSQTVTVNPNVTTTYFLTVTDDCGGTSEIDEVTVVVPVYDPISVEFPEYNSTCPGDVQVLSPNVSGGAGDFVFEWQDGTISPSFTVNPANPGPSQYGVVVTDQCGAVGQGFAVVNVPLLQPILATPNSVPSCTGEAFTLSISEITGGAGNSEDDYIYTWVDPDGNVLEGESEIGTISLNNPEPGIYTVNIVDVCGTQAAYDVVANLVGIEFIPNVISPNASPDKNDEFIVPGSSIFDTKLTILDRWGKVVYEESNYRCDRAVLADPSTLVSDNNCWDGEDVKGDVYYYILDIDNGTCTFQGTLHVLGNE